MTVPEWLSTEVVGGVVRASVLLLGGFAVAWVAGRLASQVTRRVAPTERAVFARRVTFYGLMGLVVATALGELGFDLSVLLGAAGVLTVALGFASQTSASNVISGVFLIWERPFSVGDWIRIGPTTGQVVSIDLLSVKLRTANNLYVRVPNESVMKAEITNVTRYPIRRLDLKVSVAYAEDLAKVREVVLDLCDRDWRILDEPRPVLRFEGFGESGIDLLVAAWAARENFVDVRDQFALDLKSELDAHGIEIPFPHRTLYAGRASDPIAVRMVSE